MPGGPPPWAGLTTARRSVTIDKVSAALSNRVPSHRGGAIPVGAGESAVMVVLYELGAEVNVVLTRRSPNLRHHAHEMSFPGGRRDVEDPDLWHTALRESMEEVDLDPSALRRIGELDSFMTVGSRTVVHPYVVVADHCPQLTASPHEVESITHVSFGELLRDDVWREELWPIPTLDGLRAITFFELVDDTVWGATAAMLRQLLAMATGTDDIILGGPA